MLKCDNKCSDLKEFIEQSKGRLKKILERLEWSEEKVKKVSQMRLFILSLTDTKLIFVYLLEF